MPMIHSDFDLRTIYGTAYRRRPETVRRPARYALPVGSYTNDTVTFMQTKETLERNQGRVCGAARAQAKRYRNEAGR